MKSCSVVSDEILVLLFFAEDKITKAPFGFISELAFDAVDSDERPISVVNQRWILPPGDARACQDCFGGTRAITERRSGNISTEPSLIIPLRNRACFYASRKHQ